MKIPLWAFTPQPTRFVIAAMLITGFPQSAASQIPPVDDQDFRSQTYLFCKTVGDIDGARDFRKRMLEPMQQAGTVDRTWTYAGCEPSYISSTMSPIIHIIAENSTDRLEQLVELRKYYVDVKDNPAVWLLIVNSTNTKGQTVLDYMEYIEQTKRFVPIERPGIIRFKNFICSNGGEYLVYSKHC